MVMNVYRVRGDLTYGAINTQSLQDLEVVKDFYHKRAVKSWEPIVTKTFYGLVPVDCLIWFTSQIALGQRARKILSPLLTPCGEFFPLKLQDREDFDYQWFNCTIKYSPVNLDHLEGYQEQSPYRGLVWDEITRWSFHPEAVAQMPVISRLELPSILFHNLCTDVLKNAVEEAGLVGFEFQHLWSSETGGVEIEEPPILGPVARELGRKLDEDRAKAAKIYGSIKHPKE